MKMFHKESLPSSTIVENIYAVYDKVSCRILSVFNQVSDAVAVRESVKIFISQYPIKDLVLYRIGSSRCDPFSIDFTVDKNKTVVSWELYEFPETRAESLKPLGLSKEEYDKMNLIDLYKKLKSSPDRVQAESVLEQIKFEENKIENSEVKHE